MRNLLIASILVVLSGSFVYVTTSKDITFGHPANTHMDDYFLAHGQEQTGANNIVTAVVFDFRGFDTLGEATVLFVVVLGVGMLFRRLMDGEEEDSA
jgi:multisubunit Na+/H+ antiporter MnhB subunit